MDAVLDFARGPLFRFSIAVLILGLARLVILDLIAIFEAYRRAGDKKIPWGQTIGRSLEWLVPVRRVFHNRPLYSTFSILFHVGLLLVPLFLLAHVRLWPSILSDFWPTLPDAWAYWLTISTIVFAVLLLAGRLVSRSSSFISRKQDFLWPLILLIPFVTGYLCARAGLGAGTYRIALLAHVLAGDLILILIPFTKIAHCVLMPLSHVVTAVAWKFPADTDDAICTTLNKKGAPV